MNRIELLQKLCCKAPPVMRWLMTNGYGWLLSRKRFGGAFAKFFQDFQETQYWEPSRMRAYQLERLRHVIRQAYTNVPYYRKLFQERGLTVEDFDKLESLTKLPVLTKDDIRRNHQLLINQRASRKHSIRGSSSGTTGHKLEFYLPRILAYTVDYALLWRAYSWAGIPLKARRVTLGGRWFTYKPPYWIHNRFEDQLLLSIHHLSDKTVDSYIEKIADFAPVFLQGQPTGIHYIARRMIERGRTVKLKAICTTGETLEPFQRADIENAFRAKVFETYGLGEMVVNAHECEQHAGFHEVCELGIMEFEQDKATGLYRLIGTSLWNDVMPFIRYRIDDLVELSQERHCRCGRALPRTISRIVGRIDDILWAEDGTEILPVSIRTAISPCLRSHEAYQFQQVGKRDYRFFLLGHLDNRQKARIHRVLSGLVGASANIEFERTHAVMTDAGKVRTVVNLIRQNE